jgi:polyisoprenoid-binding protein YceI
VKTRTYRATARLKDVTPLVTNCLQVKINSAREFYGAMCYPRKNWQGMRLIPLARVCGNSMKKSIFSALLLAWTITQAAAVSETYEINPKNSSVLFKVRFLWTTNIEGCFCGGVSGRVSFDPDAPQESTVKLEIKTDTLNTGVTQLNNEIKAPAFLDVEKFPLITFKNTSAQRVNDQQYTLTGDLTFHGVTKPLTLRSNPVGRSKDSKGESHTGSDIYLVIKRSEFGIKGDSPAVGDDIFLTIRVRN